MLKPVRENSNNNGLVSYNKFVQLNSCDHKVIRDLYLLHNALVLYNKFVQLNRCYHNIIRDLLHLNNFICLYNSTIESIPEEVSYYFFG